MDSSRTAAVAHASALIVEGGAMRSVFSAGLLDRFLQERFDPFDFYIGVSAGAGNLAAFLSGTPGKSLGIYLDFALRREFIDYRRFLRGGHLLDLDWLVASAVSQTGFNTATLCAQAKPLYVGVTDVTSGEALYLKAGPYNLAALIKASMALPLFYRGFPEIDGRPMTDGGVADGIPLGAAIRMGAQRIMVIRSRSSRYRKKDTWVHRYIRWKMRNHAALVATMRQRIARHQDVIDLISHPPPGIDIVDVCPPEDFTVERFSRERSSLLQGYQIGFETGEAAIARWQRAKISSMSGRMPSEQRRHFAS